MKFKTQTGIFFGHGHVIKPEIGRVERIIEKIVRGLCFHHLGLRLGGDRMRILMEPDEAPLFVLDNKEVHMVGDGVVRYVYRVITEGSESASVWYLNFFDSTQFFVYTQTR